jgi:hypothetical protein
MTVCIKQNRKHAMQADYGSVANPWGSWQGLLAFFNLRLKQWHGGHIDLFGGDRGEWRTRPASWRQCLGVANSNPHVQSHCRKGLTFATERHAGSQSAESPQCRMWPQIRACSPRCTLRTRFRLYSLVNGLVFNSVIAGLNFHNQPISLPDFPIS